jgi:hypothetical protein
MFRYLKKNRSTRLKLLLNSAVIQVALRGVAAAKSFRKELNEIAEKVRASNQRWYKFILTAGNVMPILNCSL